jgi:RNA polymerase sigma factor (sigma-70 family)
MADLPDSSPASRLVRRAVAEYESMLTGYAYNLTHDLELARDVVQDTFIRLYAQEAERLDGPGLKAWLFTVCRNRALDLLRRHRRLVSLEDSPVDHLAEPSPSPDHQAADGDETALILDSFRRLPPNQAEVLRLKFQSDLSYQEIAGITGLSASNVGFLIHTGLKRLRTLLAPEIAASRWS